MITVGLLSFIILGLLAMFNQTQRAFRTSMTQSDVLEAGRAAMDMIAREVAQTTPSSAPDILINIGGRASPYRATNFFSEPSPFFEGTLGYQPLLQGLPAMPSTVVRTNTVERFFFLTRLNQDWVGTGYDVLPEIPTNAMVGTLYRFSATNQYRSGLINVGAAFRAAANNAYVQNAAGLPVTNLSRIADGVVHFRVRAYALSGYLVVTNSLRGTNAYRRAWPYTAAATPSTFFTNAWNTIASADAINPDQSATYFMSNAAPAYVEVELGLLEPQILQRYRSIPIAGAQRQYLSNHVAQVHLFRQRIAIPNVDTTAYP